MAFGPDLRQMTDTAPTQKVPTALTFLLALACGMVAANLYYVQPLVGLISRDYGVSVAASGILVTVTQLGYAVGLVLIVPLGDILENRRLILVLPGRRSRRATCSLSCADHRRVSGRVHRHRSRVERGADHRALRRPSGVG